MADKKTRNYYTVVYPDSAPKNWIDILSEERVPAFISPLHDADVNPDGEAKKPHWHVMIMFDGPKPADHARAIFDKIGGVGCDAVVSVRGYARYLCHLDNPEKHQYDQGDVRQLSGADYVAAIGLPTDKYKAVQEMIDWCESTGCDSFADLINHARVSHFDWFRVLCDSATVVMKEYLKSKSWTSGRRNSASAYIARVNGNDDASLTVDGDTGEVIDD